MHKFVCVIAIIAALLISTTPTTFADTLVVSAEEAKTILEPEDLPKVFVGGNLEPGYFRVYAVIEAPYVIDDEVKISLRLNDMETVVAGAFKPGSMTTGKETWWFNTLATAHSSRWSGDIARLLVQGTYLVQVDVPVADGVHIRYTQEFVVPPHSVTSWACDRNGKGGGPVELRINFTNLNYHPARVWVGFDKKEFEGEYLAIDEHRGVVHMRVDPTDFSHYFTIRAPGWQQEVRIPELPMCDEGVAGGIPTTPGKG